VGKFLIGLYIAKSGAGVAYGAQTLKLLDLLEKGTTCLQVCDTGSVRGDTDANAFQPARNASADRTISGDRMDHRTLRMCRRIPFTLW